MRFKRPCRDCGLLYRPTGTSTRFCQKCKNKRFTARTKKIRDTNKRKK